MSKQIYAVFGSSGFGREVMPLAREITGHLNINKNEIIFVDDSPISNNINGHNVYKYDEFSMVMSKLTLEDAI